jgi:hypothetical protein
MDGRNRWIQSVCIAVMLTLAGVSGCRDRQERRRSVHPDGPATTTAGEWQHSEAVKEPPFAQTSKPATLPATTTAGTQPPGPTPMPVLAHAPVGQWARYRMANGVEERLEVIDRTKRHVELRLETWIDGERAGQPTVRTEPIDVDWALRAAAQFDASVTEGRTTLNVAGRQWQTRLTSARWRREGVNYERRTWTAPDGPIYGVIRMILTADDRFFASMELVSFGVASPPTSSPQ